MPMRTAIAEWKGNLAGGTGEMATGSGSFRGAYSAGSRFEEQAGTNPEELIAAAHAGCFSMALSHGLSQAGHTPESVRTEARVHLEKGEQGFSITRVELDCRARVPGMDDEAFQSQVEQARTGCPVSRALGGVDIRVDARLD